MYRAALMKRLRGGIPAFLPDHDLNGFYQQLL